MRKVISIALAILTIASVAFANPTGDFPVNDQPWMGNPILRAIGTGSVVPGISNETNTATLSGNVVIGSTANLAKPVQNLDPNGVNRNVSLPAEASNTGKWYQIKNTAALGTAFDLVVLDDAAATLATVGPGQTVRAWCDGTTWEIWQGLPFDTDGTVVIGTTNSTKMVHTETALIANKDHPGTIIIQAPITLTADLIITTQIIFRNGCTIDPNGNSLTLPSPSDIEASPLRQIFTGSGVVWSKPGIFYPGWWGATSTDTVGSTNSTAFTNMNTSIGLTGGMIKIIGDYILDDTWRPPSGCTISGVNMYATNSTSAIIGRHTNAAVMSLKGNDHNTIRDLTIKGDPGVYPKAGVVCGRSSAGSAGEHTFQRVFVTGSYSEAAVYNIASEVNSWTDSRIYVTGGTALSSLYISNSDGLLVDSLTTGSMVLFRSQNMVIYNFVSNSKGIKIVENGDTVTSLDFEGGSISGTGIQTLIEIDITNGNNGFGNYTFKDIHTEGTPEYGINIVNTSGIGRGLHNLIIRGLTQTPVPSVNFLHTDDDVYLYDCDINSTYYSGTIQPGISVYNLYYSRVVTGAKPIEIRNNSTFNDLTARNDDVTIGGTSSYDTIRYNDNLYNLTITGTTTGLSQFDLYSGRTRNVAYDDYANHLAFNGKKLYNFGILPQVGTHPKTLTTSDIGKVWHNNGAGASWTFLLPASNPGMLYGFVRVASQNILIDPNGSETIRGGGEGKYLSLDTAPDCFPRSIRIY